jgi:hypothetical protein
MRARSIVTLLVVLMPALGGVRPSTAQEPLSISGTVWHDANFDGVRQPGEEPVPQLSLLLDGTETSTDANGLYRFDGLQPGQHDIEIQTFGLVVGDTAPVRDLDGSVVVPVQLTQSQAGVDIGVIFESDVMRIFGSAWVDGAPVEQANVRAFVGDVDCTVAASGLIPPDSGPAAFLTFVAPEGLIEGCGGPDSEVGLTIEGLPAHQTLAWDYQLPYTVFTAGHPVALYAGALNIHADTEDIRAFIDGTACSATYATFGGFFLSVFSAEQVPGCGVEGAEVHPFVNGKEALQALTWHAGYNDIDFSQYVDESYSQPLPTPTGGTISPPNAGDAGLKSGSLPRDAANTRSR